jgi:hypothetical protein
MGAWAAVAVVMLTLSESAHREERASPRKPNVRTEVISEKEASFDVWCFNAMRRELQFHKEAQGVRVIATYRWIHNRLAQYRFHYQ